MEKIRPLSVSALVLAFAATALVPTPRRAAAQDYGVGIGYNDMWAQATTHLNSVPSNPVVLESPTLGFEPKQYPAIESKTYWGQRSLGQSLTSSAAGANTVAFQVQGDREDVLSFASNATVTTTVSAAVGSLHAFAAANAHSGPEGYTYTDRLGQPQHYRSTLGAGAQAEFNVWYADAITVSGAGSAGALVRADAMLDSTLQAGPGAAAWAETELQVYLYRGGSYYRYDTTVRDEITAGVRTSPASPEKGFDLFVHDGDVLYVTQWLRGGAGATASYDVSDATGIADVSHTALFRLYGINDGPTPPPATLSLSADSGLDYTTYQVPEPTGGTALACGFAMLITANRRRRRALRA